MLKTETHSLSKARRLNEQNSHFYGTRSLLQQRTSCSGLWKCFTRLFAASLMSSCTSTERIPDENKKKSQAVLKNSKNDDKPEAKALRLNRKVIKEAGCVSA